MLLSIWIDINLCKFLLHNIPGLLQRQDTLQPQTYFIKSSLLGSHWMSQWLTIDAVQARGSEFIQIPRTHIKSQTRLCMCLEPQLYKSWRRGFLELTGHQLLTHGDKVDSNTVGHWTSSSSICVNAWAHTPTHTYVCMYHACKHHTYAHTPKKDKETDKNP